MLAPENEPELLELTTEDVSTSHNGRPFDETKRLLEEPDSGEQLERSALARTKRETREKLEEGLRILARIIAQRVLSERLSQPDKPQYVQPTCASQRRHSNESKPNKGVA